MNNPNRRAIFPIPLTSKLLKLSPQLQCDVSIVLEALDAGRTQIRVGEDLQNSSWQLMKAKAADASVVSVGLEAADMPALNGWTISKYDPEQKQIDLVAKGATTLAFAGAYTTELEVLG